MPDLNSLPPSPRYPQESQVAAQAHAHLPASTTASGSPATMTSPSAQHVVPSALNILPSNQAAVISPPTSAPSQQVSGPPPGRQSLSSRTSWQSLHGGNTDLNTSGLIPIRHPRPMTAAQLHNELEQENEAVVNRLTRELSLLRAAQNASVISNTSSTSAHGDCIVDQHAHPLTSPVYPIPISPAASRRHHRAASNASMRSQTAGSISTSYEARRSSAIPLSRQGSSASRRSRTDSPGPHSIALADSTLAYLQQQRNPLPTSVPPMMGATGSLPDQVSPALLPVTPRYEETALYRAELEAAKRENDALKRRIRELERMVRNRRPSDASRQRSESVSTTASINPTIGSGIGVAPPREPIHIHTHPSHHGQPPSTSTSATPASALSQPLPSSPRPAPVRQTSASGSIAVGVPEEEVKVGESATNAGLS
ncbi:hypothetical protein Cpir12675_005155 [Ceratocystis pirilliformis]|uniref:Uncharacterized protein n=1 Tax=Ceratocystis pirilliformis TaxID=259994 RepID=A0ABR3YT14_9PEZI